MGERCAGRRLLGVFGAVVISCLALTTGASVGASSTRVAPLTLAEASQAFAATWPKFDTAFANGQILAMARYATDDVSAAASGSTGCGCAWTTPHSKVLFSVPVAHSYPLSFLAQISTPAPKQSIYSPFVTLVVLRKSSTHAPWLVAYLLRYSGTQRYLTSSWVQAAPPATFPITEVVSQFATFFTAEVTPGSPAPANTWPLTGATGQEVQGYLDVKADVQKLGDQQTTTFSPVDTSVAFAYARGDIMCGTYRSVSTVSTPPGDPTVQPADGSTWGGLLPPGSYTSLTKLGMHTFCYAVNTQASATTDVVTPISFFGGVYQVNGLPAP